MRRKERRGIQQIQSWTLFNLLLPLPFHSSLFIHYTSRVMDHGATLACPPKLRHRHDDPLRQTQGMIFQHSPCKNSSNAYPPLTRD